MIARTSRLLVSPLRPSDVDDLAALIVRPELHTATGDAPTSDDDARDRVAQWLTGPMRSGVVWINHVVRRGDTGALVGHCQATLVTVSADGATECTLAWGVHPDHRRQGIATEMMRAFVGLLVETDAPARFVAHIPADHVASEKVATALGLAPTDRLDAQGERIWVRPPSA